MGGEGQYLKQMHVVRDNVWVQHLPKVTLRGHHLLKGVMQSHGAGEAVLHDLDTLRRKRESAGGGGGSRRVDGSG